MTDARAITSGELVLKRTPGQWSRFWIAFYKPNVIYTAQLNGVPSSTDMVASIAFDTGSGTLADVKKEMSLWVGTTAGARDLGICRIRKAPISGTFYIDMTSKINWQADCHLTVVDDFRLSRRTARMDAGALKLDYDHAYLDQYEEYEPVPVLGIDAIVWLTGADVDALFDAGDSWVFGSTISGYSWEAPGASATSGMSTATPTLTYDATGYYTVYCTVTAATGKAYTGVRHVFVFGADFMPHAVELTSDPSGSLDGGGWEYDIKMVADADPTEVIEGCLAVLFGEDWYGSTKQSIGQVANRENFICSGYVDREEDIVWDAEISEVEFSVTGAQAGLGEIEVPPVKLTMATNTPASWDTMPALTIDRALWYLLHWRSNVTALMDVRLTGDTRYLPESETEGMLWEQVKELAWNKIFALPYVDRFGRLFVNIHPQLIPEADRTWETVMTITKKDWKDRINITRRKPPLSLLSTSGWICNSSSHVNIVYSLAMGHVDTGAGGSEFIDKLLASDQTQFNTLTGLYMGWKNRELDFEIALAQNNRMVDLFPPAYLDITLATGDTPRGIGYAGNLIPTSVRLAYDAEAMCFEAVWNCEQETFATLAINGDIPPSTGWDDEGWDSSTFPDFEMPDLSDLGEVITLPPETENLNHPRTVVVATNKGVFYTTNFHEDDPVWVGMNNGLTLSDFSSAALDLVVTPNGSLWLLVRAASDLLYRASSLGGTWSLMADGADLESGYINSLAMNPTAAEQIAIVAANPTTLISRIYIGNAGGLSAGGTFGAKMAELHTGLVYKNNNWYVFHSDDGTFATPWVSKFSLSGSFITSANINTAIGQDAAARYALALPTKFFQWDTSGAGGFNTVTSGLIATRFTTLNPAHTQQGVAFSPTGNYGIGRQAEWGYQAFLSTDGGATWSSLGGTIPGGSDIWENCKDDNRWIFGGGMVVHLTLDRGTTYITKTGNLDFVAPVSDVLAIRFIA